MFEVHLLCLRAGLVGRHAGRRHELDRIAGWIAELIIRGELSAGACVVVDAERGALRIRPVPPPAPA